MLYTSEILCTKLSLILLVNWMLEALDPVFFCFVCYLNFRYCYVVKLLVGPIVIF